ncbi:MAG: VOC family protein [Acidimicrobiales bacterium]
MRVTGLDHIVLVVRNTEQAMAWYRDMLGLEPIKLDEWRRKEVLFPSLRIDATTIIDLLEGEPTGENLNHSRWSSTVSTSTSWPSRTPSRWSPARPT